MLDVRAYQRRDVDADWAELTYARASRSRSNGAGSAGNVPAVTKHVKSRVRSFKGAFAYFTPEGLIPLETLDVTAFIPLA